VRSGKDYRNVRIIVHPIGWGVNRVSVYTFAAMGDLPDESQLARYFSILGKKGAKTRYARMSAEQRKELATKASKAAAKARQKKAKNRKRSPR
jgi:hypothetical protein